MKQGHKEVCHLCARPRIMKGIFKSPEEYNEADAVDLTDITFVYNKKRCKNLFNGKLSC